MYRLLWAGLVITNHKATSFAALKSGDLGKISRIVNLAQLKT